MTLVTLAQIKAELKDENTIDDPAVEAKLMRLAHYVTREWGKKVAYDFQPRLRTKKITASASNVGGGGMTLLLDEPLLELVSIVSDGTTLTYGTDVNAYPQDERAPIRMLMLSDTVSCLSWYPRDSQSWYNTITITGWWGLRNNYAEEGWIDTLTTLAANISDATTKTFQVADIDGLDALYRTPCLSAGHLFKIDSEIFEAQHTDTATNIGIALRGQRGTTAASHTSGTKVYVWNPEPDVVEALTRWACFGIARNGSFDGTSITGTENIQYPSDAPSQVYQVAQGYANGY